MKLFHILLFSILLIHSIAQNDTLFLYKDCYIKGNQCFNQIIDNKKEGKWIDFKIKKEYANLFHEVLWDGFDSLGNDTYGSYSYSYKYEPLHYRYENIPIASKEHLNGLFVILDWIPPKEYYISSKGYYENDLKQGKWINYYENGQIEKMLKYTNGGVVQNGKFYREDGSLMLLISADKYGNFKVCRYSESNHKINCSQKSLNDIKCLLE
jgi:hypothetical protein